MGGLEQVNGHDMINLLPDAVLGLVNGQNKIALLPDGGLEHV